MEMFREMRDEMVESLKKRNYLTEPVIIEAFSNVPREKFVPSRLKEDAYADRPLPIGNDQTISAPSMIAIMLEVLELEKGDKVLEVGTGSGYNAALLAEIVGSEGKVYSVERLKAVAETGRENLREAGSENVEVLIGDGTRGYEEESPWDRILVTACAPQIPQPLVDQLRIGGKLAIPVGSSYMSQTLLLVERTGEDEKDVRRHGGCAFVPLVGEYGWDKGEAR